MPQSVALASCFEMLLAAFWVRTFSRYAPSEVDFYLYLLTYPFTLVSTCCVCTYFGYLQSVLGRYIEQRLKTRTAKATFEDGTICFKFCSGLVRTLT